MPGVFGGQTNIYGGVQYDDTYSRNGPFAMVIAISNHLVNGGKILQGEDYSSEEELHAYATLQEKKLIGFQVQWDMSSCTLKNGKLNSDGTEATKNCDPYLKFNLDTYAFEVDGALTESDDAVGVYKYTLKLGKLNFGKKIILHDMSFTIEIESNSV